jgi:hypothetical protein
MLAKFAMRVHVPALWHTHIDGVRQRRLGGGLFVINLVLFEIEYGG